MNTFESNLEGIQSHIANITVDIPKQIADVGQKMEKIDIAVKSKKAYIDIAFF